MYKQYGYHMALLFMNDSRNCITKSTALYWDASPLPLTFMWAEKGASNKTRRCCGGPPFWGGGPAPAAEGGAQRGRARGAQNPRRCASLSRRWGRQKPPAAARPRFPAGKSRLRCSSSPPPHGVSAESGVLHGNFVYLVCV